VALAVAVGVPVLVGAGVEVGMGVRVGVRVGRRVFVAVGRGVAVVVGRGVRDGMGEATGGGVVADAVVGGVPVSRVGLGDAVLVPLGMGVGGRGLLEGTGVTSVGVIRTTTPLRSSVGVGGTNPSTGTGPGGGSNRPMPPC
jgi:NF-X1-type zinc finger protein NFXL1